MAHVKDVQTLRFRVRRGDSRQLQTADVQRLMCGKRPMVFTSGRGATDSIFLRNVAASMVLLVKVATLLWTFMIYNLYGFVWKCWVYSQWNSHLIGIRINKTIGFRGLAYFQTHPYDPLWSSFALHAGRYRTETPTCETWQIAMW